MNRKRALLTLLMVQSFIVCVAQQQQIDSLEAALKSRPLTETNEVKILAELGGWLQDTNSSQAAEYLFKALHISEKLSDTLLQANALATLGNIMVDKSQYQQAVGFYLKAMDFYELKKDTVGAIKSQHGLGRTFTLLKNYDKAIFYFEEALKKAVASKKRKVILPAYMNLGVAYQETGNDEKALENYEKVRVLLEKGNSKFGQAILYNNISVVLQKQNKSREALVYVKKAYALFKEIGNPYNLAQLSINFSEVYLALNRIDSSLYWGRMALESASTNHYADLLMDANKKLSDATSLAGNFKDAFAFLKKYEFLKDSLYNERELGLVQQLHEGYQLGKKEEEIHSLKALQEKLALDLKVNRLYTVLGIVISVSLMIILGVITYNYFRKQKLAAALDNQNKEIQRLNQVLEIKALRSQMDPHFVFNALNGLQHFLTSHSAEESINYLSKVARLIRLTLQNASRDWVKLSEEMEILKLYLQVEQYRFPDKINFEFQIDPETENMKIPFLVVQPYVENAVLHGLIPKQGGTGKLTIRAHTNHDILTVEVEDNGVGRGAHVQKTDPMFTSMGSGLVRERLHKLSIQMGASMEGRIDDLKDEYGKAAGTKSLLTFDFRNGAKAVAA